MIPICMMVLAALALFGGLVLVQTFRSDMLARLAAPSALYLDQCQRATRALIVGLPEPELREAYTVACWHLRWQEITLALPPANEEIFRPIYRHALELAAELGRRFPEEFPSATVPAMPQRVVDEIGRRN